ncbi:hypothetical protein SAMN04490178_13436 [Propionispora vibrioides]|uniref:Uncharacterized protein n=1 Tax=Propionispora vibrioides TaxID=112903 RepID=A0A1H8XYR7_9FIRM|nr:hypothetical protein SAMN04490178_13436 [Propionispora vibrioides]
MGFGGCGYGNGFGHSWIIIIIIIILLLFCCCDDNGPSYTC